MNEEIMRACGFKEELERVKMGRCPMCSEPITEFRDDLSRKEYGISGMCQKCQDDVFGRPERDKKRDQIELGPNDILVGVKSMIPHGNPETYSMYTGKSGRTWMVGDTENAGAHVYVSADPRENVPGYRGFRGYGGSTLSFKLSTGETVELKGPWHSNSDALKDDTGVDVTSKHLTYVVIARSRDGGFPQEILRDVAYKDDASVLGDFYRGTLLAMELAKKMDTILYCYSESRGGSSCSPVYPDQLDVNGKRPKK